MHAKYAAVNWNALAGAISFFTASAASAQVLVKDVARCECEYWFVCVFLWLSGVRSCAVSAVVSVPA